MHRQKQNRTYKASMRATESSERTVQRHKAHKASVRKPSNISAEQAIVHFHSDIENGPYFVCTCCHRLMYSKSVATMAKRSLQFNPDSPPPKRPRNKSHSLLVNFQQPTTTPPSQACYQHSRLYNRVDIFTVS